MQEFLDTYWNLIHSNFHYECCLFYSLIKDIKHNQSRTFLYFRHQRNCHTIFCNNGLAMDSFMKMGVCLC